ncbi:MAG TPA: hypothetical protein VHS58_19120, partial [Acetobacteraceae bacterium]|nr:hypothetical protein [Acetobacteraceae bacterium]
RALVQSIVTAISAVPSIAYLAWCLLAYNPMPTENAPWGITDVLSPVRAFFGQFSILLLIAVPLLATPFTLAAVRRTLSDRLVAALSLLIVLHVSLVVIAALIHPGWMQNKNFYAVFPAGYLLLAIVLDRNWLMRTSFGPRFASITCAVALITYLATGYPNQKVSFYSPFRDQVREAAQLIAASSKPADTILVGAIDMNGNDYLITPTRIYATEIARGRVHWSAGTVTVFPPSKYPTARLTSLQEATKSRNPDGKLIIDLPHDDSFGPAETAFLQSVAACVVEHRLVKHRVLVVEFDARRCGKWQESDSNR